MEYFAALPQDRLAGELQARIDAYQQWILMTGRLARWRVAFNTYYGQRGSHNSSFVQSGGEKGELSFLMSNEYRNLCQHLLVMVKQSRTALETVAVNTESRSKAQAYVAKGLVEYFRRDGRVDQNAYGAAEISLIMDTGWVFNEWDYQLGTAQLVNPDTQKPESQGGMKTRARTPLDVIIDFSKPDATEHDWRMVRDPVNKFNLAAMYKEHADELTGMSRDRTDDAIYRFGDVALYQAGDTSPDVDMFTFYHRKTPALPQGRMVQMVGKLILFDGPIPYRKLPGNRICPAEMILSPLGYSNTNDLLALQDVMDALISAAVTNMTTCGVNNIWAENGDNLDFDQLAAGMNFLTNCSKPETIMLNRLPPEWFQLANFIVGRMEAISGVNSVARGNTEGKDFSGAAMALLQSMAIQFNNGFVRSVNKLDEDNGNDIIQLTQDFVKEPVMGMIIGANNRYMMKEYSAKDLNLIQRVYCRQSNPLKDTTAGRLTLVQEASKIEGGLSKAEFAELIDTGNTDCLLEKDRNLRLTIDQENEAMLRGEMPPVLASDNHPEHMQGHRGIFASPDDRKDPALVKLAEQHEQMHLQVWQNTDPNILRAYNIPPFILPAPMLGPDGKPLPPPGAPPMGPPGPGGPGKPPAPNSAPPSALAAAPGGPPVKAPGMPQNPLSNQPWNPETGGLPT